MKKNKSREQFWLDHIKNFLKSDMSQIEYCKLHNLAKGSFSARKSLFKKQGKLSSSNSEMFVPIKTKVKKEEFSIKLSSGLELAFSREPDPAWIAKVICEMRSINAFS